MNDGSVASTLIVCGSSPSRPQRSFGSRGTLWLSRLRLVQSLVAGSVVVVGAFALWLAFGSGWVGLRYLRGERLILAPGHVRVVPFSETEPGVGTTEVRNYTAAPVRLLGSAVPCTCVRTQELPVTIPTGGRASFSIQVHATPGKRKVDETVVIYTDHPEHPFLRFRVSGVASNWP